MVTGVWGLLGIQGSIVNSAIWSRLADFMKPAFISYVTIDIFDTIRAHICRITRFRVILFLMAFCISSLVSQGLLLYYLDVEYHAIAMGCV